MVKDLLYDFKSTFIPKVIRTITEELKDNLSYYDISDVSDYDMSGDFGCKFRIKKDVSVEVTVHYNWLGEQKGFFVELIGEKNGEMLSCSMYHPLSLCSNGVDTLIKVIEHGEPVDFCKKEILNFIMHLKEDKDE